MNTMFCPFSRLFHEREILWNLVRKSLKTKYAGSLLGILWAFINPLLLALIVGFVFTNILKTNMENFYLFVVSGMLPWAFLSGSLQDATVSIQGHASILKQFSFPREFIPISLVLSHFILLLLGLAVVAPFFLIMNSQVFVTVFLLLAALALFLLFTVGLSLIVAALCVDYRDIHQGFNTLLMLWLWLTPIFYPIETVPEEYRVLFHMNPVSPFINLFRQALLSQTTGWADNCTLAALIALAVFVFGLWVFRRREGGFLKRI